MTIIDLNKNLAADAIIAAGFAVDRLKRFPVEALTDADLLDDDSSRIYGYEAVKRLAVHLALLAEVMIQSEVHKMVRGVA